MPGSFEILVLARLVAAAPRERAALEGQLAELVLRGELSSGEPQCSINLQPRKGQAAGSLSHNPVTGIAPDSDSVPIVFQLILDGGWLAELAMFKADGSSVVTLPSVEAIAVKDTDEARPGKVQHLWP